MTVGSRAVDPRLQAHLDVAAASDEAFVDTAFARRCCAGLPMPRRGERALAKLAEGTLSRATLLHELVTAAEFDRVRQLDDVISFARGARARGERPRHLQAPPATDERLVEVPWVLVAAPPGPGARGRLRLRRAGLPRRSRRGCAGRARRRRPRRRRRSPGFETVVADVRAAAVPGRVVRSGPARLDPRAHRRRQRGRTASRGAPTRTGRAAALRELRRVLRASGRLLVTVPLGEPGDYGWFRQEDVGGWTRLFTGAGFFVEEQEAYELGEDGWRSAPAFDPGRRRLRHARAGRVGGPLRRAQPAPAAPPRLARRHPPHRATAARAVVPQAARCPTEPVADGS